MGITSFDPREVRQFMEQQSRNYYGDTYHLIIKNCNHFSDDICYKLTGKRIPKWVNRLARIGILNSELNAFCQTTVSQEDYPKAFD